MKEFVGMALEGCCWETKELSKDWLIIHIDKVHIFKESHVQKTPQLNMVGDLVWSIYNPRR